MTQLDLPIAAEIVEAARGKWESRVFDMTDVVLATCRRQKAPDAEQLAVCIVMELCNYMGGDVMYFPRGERLRLAVRDRQIFLEHKTGVSLDILIRRYRLTRQRLTQIIERQQAMQPVAAAVS